MKLRLKREGDTQPTNVEIESLDPARPGEYLAHVADARHEIQLVRRGAHGGWLRVHGRVLPFHTARSNETIEVWLGGRVYRLQVVERTSARRATAASDAIPQEEIKAPMPGTILKINAGIGEPFAAHAPLIVMESMKMEMALSVPHAGRVREILCKTGELVTMGQVLARLEQESVDVAAAGQNR